MHANTTTSIGARGERLAGWNLLYLGLIVTIVLGLALAGAPPAQASHRWAGWHQTKMHSAASGQEEAACVEVGNSHNSYVDFRQNVRRKMYVDNPAADWDGLASNRIWLDLPFVNGSVQPCSKFPNRAVIPIELYMAHDTTIKYGNWIYANACGANVACAKNDVDVWNPVVGHWDKRDSYLWFPEKTLYYTSSYNANGSHPWHNDFQRAYVVSHEFGHVFGLGDGGWSGDTLCKSSVMHAGKGACGATAYVYWPQTIDRDSVIWSIYNR
jgi:hypothetical protein